MCQKDSLATFLDALSDCFGLWSSRFDESFNMLTSNSIIPNLHRKLLLTPERIAFIEGHTGKGAAPLIVGAKIGILWSIVTGQSDGRRELYVLGPILTQPVTWSMAEKLIEPYNLSFFNKRGLIDCVMHIPVISTVSFFQFTALLHRYVTGSAVSVSDFIYDMPTEYRHESAEERSHSPLINEYQLLGHVKSGNLDFRGALATAGTGSRGIRASIDPIRQAKYSVVAFITLCARAAIEGGLSADVAYTLSDTYTEMVDGCRSISEIAAVSHTMYEDYIRRVHKIRSAPCISRPIQSSKNYIEEHVTDAITAEVLAERLGYTPHYFTRLFKAETGFTVKDFILRTKIDEAKCLLINTEMSVLNISESLKFSSQSYFTHQFERVEGMTPSQFRQKNQKVN